MSDPLPILYQDDQLVAVNKPAGLLVHRSPLDPTERRFALQLLRDQLGQHVYPVHRLDKPTSGVLLFALNEEMAGAMAKAFADRQIEKHYLAVVRGWPDAEGAIEYPLGVMDDKKGGRAIRKDKQPQEAITKYRRLATAELDTAVTRYPTSRYALMQAIPKTGRKHQIRRHFRHISHPIIGDGKHGEGRHNRYFRDVLGCDRMLLHAEKLSFNHTITQNPISISAPLDEAMQALIAQLFPSL